MPFQVNAMFEAPATRLSNIHLPTDVTLGERELCDLEMLLSGAFFPLKGYLNFADFCSVVTHTKLVNGDVWPIPISLPILKSQMNDNNEPAMIDTQQIRLRSPVGTVLGIVYVDDCYVPHLDIVAKYVFGTTDTNHPYVNYLKSHHEQVIYIGGHVVQVHPILHFDFRDLRMTPEEAKNEIKKNNWEVIVGFQTRNPLHRSHFELTCQALEEAKKLTNNDTPVLFLTPACGVTQPGDVRMNIRVRCYQKILPYYKNRGYQLVKLILLPLQMRMGGPKEALWHALIRKNYGCTHFIVGRDHAGPSTRQSNGTPFYQPYEAHELIQSLQHLIHIVPIFGKTMVYIEKHGYVQEDKVPNGIKPEEISGTRFRHLLQEQLSIPDWYSFPSIIKELQLFYKKRIEQGFCVYFTGLPCSGKSTLASAIEAALQERTSERREVTVFDADIIRLHLSKGLGFSRQDRSINVRRIGYVASLVVKHGGICVVANIAPYEDDRLFNRNLITTMGGGYIEVYVSTPLHICEGRDVKQLYKNARLGVIKQFTGISDPYEVPKSPELTIDSSDDIFGKVSQVMEYLEIQRWIMS